MDSDKFGWLDSEDIFVIRAGLALTEEIPDDLKAKLRRCLLRYLECYNPLLDGCRRAIVKHIRSLSAEDIKYMLLYTPDSPTQITNRARPHFKAILLAALKEKISE